MRPTRAIVALLVASLAGTALADEGAGGERSAGALPEHAPRRPDASLREIFAGPFPSSRLFAMPTAEVVGAYQLSLSGDVSLLTETNVLSTASVVAIGFGDIAQLEYRSTEAITTQDELPIALPALGVQLKLPYRARGYIPALAVALRFGLPHAETSADGLISHEERTTDLYAVGSIELGQRFVLHGGMRVSAAEITSAGQSAPANAKDNLFLPALGAEALVGRDTRLVAEVALVPLFDPGDAAAPSRIGSGIFGRLGARWRLLPWLVADASVGYRIEVERLAPVRDSSPHHIIEWDIRLGGEVLVPWGALVCRSYRAFCE